MRSTRFFFASAAVALAIFAAVPTTAHAVTSGFSWAYTGSSGTEGFILVVEAIEVLQPSTLALGVIVLAGLSLCNWRRRSRG